MKRTMITIALALGLTGCAASQQRMMVKAERVLEAGSSQWDSQVDKKIEECRAKDLPTPEARAECVGETKKINDEIVEPAVTAAVAALRAYWIGVAVGEDPKELRRHIDNFIDAIDDLPPETFGGLLRLVR